VSVILEKQRQGRGGEREERPGPGGNCWRSSGNEERSWAQH
jgi:hypothetical protein